MRLGFLAFVMLPVALAQTPAAAEETTEAVTRSNELFQQGKAALAQGDVDGACERFEESHRLAPRGGTILNLALCHEQQGRLLAALQELRAALEKAELDGREDRVALTNEHIAAIEAQLAWLELEWSGEFQVAAASLELDGDVIEIPADRSIAVLPGQHLLRVSAEGYDPQAQTFVLQAGGRAKVTFGPLAHASRPSAPQPEPAVVAPTPGVAELPAPSLPAPEATDPLQAVRTTALVVGIIALSVGVGSAIWALERKAAVNDHCDSNTNTCDSAGLEANQTGKAAALASTVAFSVGAVALGTWVFLPGGPGHSDLASTGLSVSGRF